MARLGDGDEQALAELVRRYQNDVFRFCLHYLKNVETARELTQETFLRIYAARDRFDVDRSFKPWMLCIARNLSLNELKKKRSVRMESIEEYASTARDDDGGLTLAADDGPAEKAIAQERAAALLNVLKTLPLEAQEIVSLRFFDRRSAREIAEIIESTEGAVRTRLHRILRQLRNECKDLLE
jgi:RNA polymerase sigma-70 factor (ECF subfamily)